MIRIGRIQCATARRTVGIAAALAGLCAIPGPAAAERLIASLSNHRVLVGANYTGDELVLFGTVERDAATVSRRGPYSIVVTVTGPRLPLRTRRAARVLGVWVNVNARMFVDPPSYLAVLASRPLDTITGPETRQRLQLGLDDIQLAQRIGGASVVIGAGDPFRAALIRIKTEQGLYREAPNAVTFLTPTLYRTSIPLPAEIPVGNYEVDVKLFADGNMIARAPSAFELVKVGFEQFVANSAHNHGLLYGLATAMMALATGWLAALMFRRD
jgi:uncharacterized protein (TIGR02186 family)